MTRRLLPLTMALVVAVFVASTVYSQLLLSSDVDALDIASNSAPSIADLADARAALRLVGRDPAHASEHRRSAEAALAEYAKTPDYAGEEERYRVVRQKLDTLDARMAAGQSVDGAIDEADAALRDLTQLNREHLRSAEQSIARAGRRRNLYAFLLDGIGIVVAFFATILAARTVDRYIATLRRRTRELEHLAIQVGHEIANPLAPIQVALHANDESDPARRAALERARRALTRIKDSIERLSSFARAAVPPATPSSTPLEPALTAAAGAAGVEAHVDSSWQVACPEAELRQLLMDLIAASVTTGSAVDVAAAGGCVRVSVTRPRDGAGDPFDPQLHTPGAEHPGIDLRLATVRRYVEACGGRVGVRRSRSQDELWIDLPRA